MTPSIAVHRSQISDSPMTALCGPAGLSELRKFVFTKYMSVLTGSKFLLIPFANSLDPDQDRQNVGPDLDPNCLTL